MGKPSSPFQDASISGNTQQNENLFDEIFTGQNVNSALKAGVTAGIKLVPAVGSLLSGLVGALWPDKNKNKGLVWNDIESKVQGIAAGLINKNNSDQMRNITEGLYNVMQLYIEQEPNTTEKGQYFSNVMSALANAQPYYFNDKTPWDNLAYFASMGTLHLTVFREQHLFYSQIYGHSDPQAAKHQKNLEALVKRYLTARNQIIHKCLQWHKEQIATEWHKKDSGYWNTNDVTFKDPVRGVSEPFHWSENDDFIGKKKYEARKIQFEKWVETGYRAQIEALLGASFSWPLFSPTPQSSLADENPANVDEGQITDTTVRRLVMDYPGWICDGTKSFMRLEEPFWFDHEKLYRKHGPISKIVVHAGDQIDGIEVFYGGVAAGVRGKIGGSQHETLDLQPGEMITGLWAHDFSETLTHVKFQSTTEDGTGGKTIQCGRADWIQSKTWKYSFDGHNGGFKGDATKRLLWFSGFSIAYGNSGWIFRLLPVFGHYDTWGPFK